MLLYNNIFTQIINGKLIIINQDDRIVRASILANNGSISITGTAFFQNQASESILLYQGQAFTFEGTGSNAILQGLIIDATNGQGVMMLTQQ